MSENHRNSDLVLLKEAKTVTKDIERSIRVLVNMIEGCQNSSQVWHQDSEKSGHRL